MTNELSESRRDRVVNLTVMEIHSNADLAGLISMETIPCQLQEGAQTSGRWDMGEARRAVIGNLHASEFESVD